MIPFKIEKLNQEKIVSDFANLAGQIRIGCEIDKLFRSKNLHLQNIEAYHQESGRAGRDSPDLCTAAV